VAKRLTNRTVRVILKGRDPRGRLALLREVEETFRPRDLEIIVAPSEDPTDSSLDEVTVVNEKLETDVREECADALDALEMRDKDVSRKVEPVEAVEIDVGRNPITDQAKRRAEAESRIATFLKQVNKEGWRIAVTTAIQQLVKYVV
jgi:hypothetical protein